MRILIKNGRVIDPANHMDQVLDLYIDNGVICELDENLDYTGADTEVIDAKGMIVAPGLVDMHVHLREPGQEHKETIETGSKSAALGGVTSIACMPNTNPVIDSAYLVEYVKSRPAYVNVFPIGAITKGQKGEELAPIGEMKFAGVVAISDDGRPVENPMTMRHALEYAATFDTTVISHCEDLRLAGGGVMNRGYMATVLGLRGISNASEEVMVARDILLAEDTQTAVHIAHISTKGSVELIRQAKRRGVKVTCETCPHYFTLTEEAVDEFNTMAKMNPPLRTAADVEAIKTGLADGTIDAIATDHAPHSYSEKNREFDKALNGIVGLETSLPLGITYLVNTGVLTLSQLIMKMSYAPAHILGLNKGSLQCGKAADVILFNLEEEYIVDVNAFASKSKNSPFHGYQLKGKVRYTIVGGKIIVREGTLL